MKKIQEYVKDLENNYEELRNEYLLQHGYVNEEISDKNMGGYIFDPSSGKYYKTVPIKGSDEELNHLVDLDKKCNSLKNYQGFANLIKGIAILNLIIVAILGIIISAMTGKLSIFFIIFYFDIIFSIILWSIAKVIEIINNK